MGFSFNLNVVTLNCCSLKKNIDLIRQLASDSFDIIFLQETFVIDEKLGILDYIDENFESIGVPAVYSDKNLMAGVGRPEGGLAILWRRGASFRIHNVVLENNFIVLDILVSGLHVILVNVYLNSDTWEVCTLERYLQSLSCLEDILRDYNYDSIFFVGDFNADPLSGRAWRSLSRFMSENSLVCYDVLSLPADSHTFIGYGNSSCRWLDHIGGKILL